MHSLCLGGGRLPTPLADASAKKESFFKCSLNLKKKNFINCIVLVLSEIYFIPRTAVLDGGEAVEGDVELGDDVYTKGVKKEKPKKKILVIF